MKIVKFFVFACIIELSRVSIILFDALLASLKQIYILEAL